MRAINRYLFVFLIILILLIIYLHLIRYYHVSQQTNHVTKRRSYLSDSPPPQALTKQSYKCSLQTCVEHIQRCTESLRIYIITEPSSSSSITPLFKSIINSIRESRFYEPNASRACLLIDASRDTLDRDPLSVHFRRIHSLPNDGQSYIVFNLFSGSWPSYDERDLSGFTASRAIHVRASASIDTYRKDYDISLPLFSRDHYERGNTISTDNHNQYSEHKHLLVFKGKRYTYGIGSETRNSLHHLHSPNDGIVILTTCKHGKRNHRDDRCEFDDQKYDDYDYASLMGNSTYCLCPRGRRLSSFRFLESLKFGCIPIVLSNRWILPFSDIIDWSSASIRFDERSLFSIADSIASIPIHKRLMMRHNALRIYDTYFSSIERITLTALTIIEQRILHKRSNDVFLYNLQPIQSSSNFDVIIIGENRLSRQLRHVLHKHPHVHQIHRSLNATIETDALLLIRDDFPITIEEMTFGFHVFKHFPSRVITLLARDHRFIRKWTLTTQWSDTISTVTFGAVFIHSYFWHSFISHNPLLAFTDSCFELKFAFFMSHVTRESPLKITHRHVTRHVSDDDSDCLTQLLSQYSYMPLIHTQIRFDPTLFLDAVSVKRKSYRAIESL